MDGFDAGDADADAAKVFEPGHGTRGPFDGAVIFFDEIAEFDWRSATAAPASTAVLTIAAHGSTPPPNSCYQNRYNMGW